jgi:UDP-N-acetylmuramate dehydrogenase
LGVGSNTLARDGGVIGVVIRLGRGFNYINHTDTFIHAGSATLDLNLALYCQEYSLQGLEFLAGIPGTIGGAIAMNAGAYGRDISRILIAAQAINIDDGAIKMFTGEDINYTYRSKGLSSDWIFTEGIFNSAVGNHSDIARQIKEIQTIRADTQPLKSKTGGSTFKNPDGLKAWKLIDEAGCRGLKIGGAQISAQHCNFLINTGDATSKDLEQLILTVQTRVFEHSGHKLELEIKIIGEQEAN